MQDGFFRRGLRSIVGLFVRFLMLGGGKQGSAAAYDLCRREGVERVVLADQAAGPVAPFLEPFQGGTLEVIALDARDAAQVRAAMAGVDAVLNALPYYFNGPVTELAIEAGIHYCDLGGNTEIVNEQKGMHAQAQAAGVSIVPDCGLAPGMVNILAQACIDGLDEADVIEMRVGGLPQHPKPPLNYQIAYSLEGMLDYCVTPSLVVRNGEVRTVDPLTEIEMLDFPGLGELEAFHTAGGISTMPHRYQGQVAEMNYKTLRYPGHAHILKAMRDLGLVSEDPIEVDGCTIVPKQAFIEIVTPSLLNPEGDDLVALRVEGRGTKDGKATTIRYDLLDRYDPETGVTAMMRTTGYSLAITALMQVDGRIESKGVFTPDECVPASTYLEELNTSGVEVRRVL